MYVHDNLLSDEKIIYWTRPHWIIFFTPLMVFIFAVLVLIYGDNFLQLGLRIFDLELNELVSLVFFLIAVIYGIGAFIRYSTSEYAVTNKRILMKTGWISRNVLELFLTKIEALHVQQTILGRILNYGTLIIVGTGGTKDPLPYVPEPLNFRKVTQFEVDRITSQTGN